MNANIITYKINRNYVHCNWTVFHWLFKCVEQNWISGHLNFEWQFPWNISFGPKDFEHEHSVMVTTPQIDMTLLPSPRPT